MNSHDSVTELVSVIIPAHNSERFIAATLMSALTQTHAALEVIVIDDGSTDATAAIVDRFIANDRRVRMIRQPQGGVARARNRGIAEARGDYIAPLDADDLWHPEKIAEQLAVIRASANIGCVTTWCCRIDVDGDILWEPRDSARWSGHVLPALLLEDFAGCASSPLLRRACVLAVGGYDESLRDRGAQGCEDYSLLLSIAERYDFAVVPRPLTGYRLVPDSMSGNLWAMLRSHDLVMARARSRHPEIPPEVFRWARSGICTWLATRAASARMYGAMARLIVLVIRSDWLYFIHRLLRLGVRLCERALVSVRGGSAVKRRPFPEGLGEERHVLLPNWIASVLERHRLQACAGVAPVRPMTDAGPAH